MGLAEMQDIRNLVLLSYLRARETFPKLTNVADISLCMAKSTLPMCEPMTHILCVPISLPGRPLCDAQEECQPV